MLRPARATLGPLPGIVALERSYRNSTPELLDEAGVIARRTIEIGERDADMGAMLARNLLWHVNEQAGDGAATAGVVLQEVFDRGLAYIAAGGNPMELRRHLLAGAQLVADELTRLASPIRGQQQLTQLANTVCHDAELAGFLGQMLDIIGEHGQLEIRAGRGRVLEQEYVEGMYWSGKPFSRDMLVTKPQLRVDLADVAILISDLEISAPEQLGPVLDAALAGGAKSLLVIARSAAASVVGLLISKNVRDRIVVVGSETPYIGASASAALDDMAILTGGRAILKAAGDTLQGVRPEDLGHARRCWADQNYFGILGARGDPRVLRRHVAALRAAFSASVDPDARRQLRQRIGKLLGGSATLWTGGITETEIEARKALAERTSEAVRGALSEGTVPGGGAALLDCRHVLRSRAETCLDADEKAAFRILGAALEAPMRTIVANAGYDAPQVLAAVDAAGPGCGFDVCTGQAVEMRVAGIVDSLTVTRTAFVSAVSAGALALTTDVLVHRSKPTQSTKP